MPDHQPTAKRWSTLAWDSEFFGFGIGRIQATDVSSAALAEICDEARAAGLRCLYWLVPGAATSQQRLATAQGFEFVDLRLELARDLAVPPHRTSTEVRTADTTDSPALRELFAATSFDTRFSRDTRFPAEKATELYQRWIARDLAEHTVLVATGPTSTVLLGAISLQCDEDRTGHIGLLAVAPTAAGRGVGQDLVSAALHHFAEQSCPQARVVTQGTNVAAQRVYQKAGFRTASADLWFHHWL